MKSKMGGAKPRHDIPYADGGRLEHAKPRGSKEKPGWMKSKMGIGRSNLAKPKTSNEEPI